jgi:SagB-type dehydrogenase family enzyme
VEAAAPTAAAAADRFKLLSGKNKRGSNLQVVAPFFISTYGMRTQQFQKIVQYHETTKHHYERYANSPGHMDWKNQPNPFRIYENTPLVKLPLLEKDPVAEHQELYHRNDKSALPFEIENIAGFLELSLGLSAWKAAGGSKWSLRMNPSSGNLHPTEAYLIIPPMPSVDGGVYHYNSLIHALEQRAGFTAELWNQVESHYGTPAFLIGISSIFWRESWKYGERAFRYCNHDAGHALAALSISANLFGWKMTYLNGLSDDAIEHVLGFNTPGFQELEKEHPDFLCLVTPCRAEIKSRSLPDQIISAFTDLTFSGNPNQLSPDHLNWEIIYRAAQLTRKPATRELQYNYGNRKRVSESTVPYSATQIIRNRRSATSFDSSVSVTKAQLLSMLDKTLPRNNTCPFDVDLMSPETHLLLFIHNVTQMPAGLYFFLRNETDAAEIRQISRPEFLWKPVEEGFPLFLLEAGNFRQQAMMVSCHQEIAGYSAFSLGMITRFKTIIEKEPFRYRHLFWETGMIGQVFYLEAEAHGVRGTGIGCFFDDAVHDLLGFKDNRFQSLYHFTIGRPVEDSRLTTYPPYHHLKMVP